MKAESSGLSLCQSCNLLLNIECLADTLTIHTITMYNNYATQSPVVQDLCFVMQFRVEIHYIHYPQCCMTSRCYQKGFSPCFKRLMRWHFGSLVCLVVSPHHLYTLFKQISLKSFNFHARSLSPTVDRQLTELALLPVLLHSTAPASSLFLC